MLSFPEIYSRISPRLAGRGGTSLPTRLHAHLLERSRGRFGSRFLGADVLVLRSTGRQSGLSRMAPMFYIHTDEGVAVVAANAASPRPPAWWLNLQAQPQAEMFLAGTWTPIEARRASPEESERLWPRLVEAYRGNEYYRSIAKRELPVVLLNRR